MVAGSGMPVGQGAGAGAGAGAGRQKEARAQTGGMDGQDVLDMLGTL